MLSYGDETKESPYCVFISCELVTKLYTGKITVWS
jgi:hypothetical protein